MNTTIARIASAAMFFVGVCSATAQPEPPGGRPDERFPSITVLGQGEAEARPDRAVVRLGAVAQAAEAAAAQQQVNQTVRKAIDQIKALGIPAERIQTSGISLHPVYSQVQPRPGQEGAFEPKITGYQASNTVRVQVDDLSKIGGVIDAGVGAGANQVQGVSFELQDDTAQKRAALTVAARRARAKAEAIADAMNVRLGQVVEVLEGGGGPVYPMMDMGRVAMSAEGAPVEPGQVRVEATLTVRYRIHGGPARGDGPAPVRDAPERTPPGRAEPAPRPSRY